MIPCRFSDDIPDIRIFLGILPLLQYSPCGKKRVILALLCFALSYHILGAWRWETGGWKESGWERREIAGVRCSFSRAKCSGHPGKYHLGLVHRQLDGVQGC